MATIGAGLEVTAARARSTPDVRPTPLLAAWEMIERIGCAAALAALTPALAMLAGTVACISKQSPFVAHRRVGRRGATLWVWKFRTMWDSVPSRRSVRLVEYLQEPFVPLDKSSGDPRVTHPFGRWMRRHSLDELPQLLHVIAGHMALAGPRPLTASELGTYYGAAAAEVLAIKPGITGLWQVSGRSKLSYEERLQFDVEFVRGRSLGLYWSILLRTLPVMFRGEDSC